MFEEPHSPLYTITSPIPLFDSTPPFSPNGGRRGGGEYYFFFPFFSTMMYFFFLSDITVAFGYS